MKFAALGLLAAVSLTLVAVAITPQGIDDTASSYVPPTAPAGTAAVVLSAVDTARQTSIRAALEATSWPTLSPGLDAFTNKGRGVLVSAWMKDGCLADDSAQQSDPVANAAHCVYGNPNGSKTAVLYGDSVAISYIEGIKGALGDDWRILVYTMASCSFSDVPVTLAGGEVNTDCKTFRTWVLGQVSEIKPALTIVSQASDEGRLQSGATGNAAVGEYGAGAQVTLTALGASSTDVVVLGRPQSSTSLLECYTPSSKPANCLGHVRDVSLATVKSLATAAPAAGPNVRFVDTNNWFCYYGDCPSFIDDIPVKADYAHLTEQESASLVPLMKEALLPAA